MPIRLESDRVRDNLYMESYIQHILIDSTRSSRCHRDALRCAPSCTVRRKPLTYGLDSPCWCGPCASPWPPGVRPPPPQQPLLKTQPSLTLHSSSKWPTSKGRMKQALKLTLLFISTRQPAKRNATNPNPKKLGNQLRQSHVISKRQTSTA
jgi:hypothetical protein